MNSKNYYFPVKWGWEKTAQYEGTRIMNGNTKEFLFQDSITRTNEPLIVPPVDELHFNFLDGTLFTEIDLNGLQITNYKLPSLSRFTDLKYLNLSSNNFREDLYKIGRGKSLESLYLSDNPYLKGTLKELEGLTNLKTLEMSRTSISGNLDGLASLVNLERLVLRDNDMYFYLNETFRYLPKLKYLDICRAKPAGRLYNVFLNNSELEHLNITTSYNSINGPFVDLQNCKKLTYFALEEHDCSGDLDVFAELTELTELYIGSRYLYGDIVNSDGISNLENLRNLRLDNNRTLEGTLNIDGSIENIEKLECNYCSYSTAPDNIEKAAKLTYLDFRRNFLDTDEIDRILQALVDNEQRSGWLHLQGDDMAKPSDDGYDNKDILEDRGWAVWTE